ncbi:hypothetical protein [Cupriavidus sp. IDO]|uniref:hypothetical protein n=1 Tax=Cupriavidus sp. IDO TaxID=1539142 RepID=UPI0005794A26|nr:hypothetical protein [Cupriavidus sp. IDO]KWR87349.1 hypothetical protein RM96_25110 [Cupriavidus sp. IDO]
MPAGRSAQPNSRLLKLLHPLAAAAAVMLSSAVFAQPVRVIPDDAQQAKLVIAAPAANAPQSAKLDGRVVGVAPGLRLFGTDNQLLSTAAVAGQKLPVRYKLDLYGQLLTAWVLSEQEQKALKAKP